MVCSSKKNIHVWITIMLLSSCSVVLLVVGVIMEKWTELVPKAKEEKINHSPWMKCCSTTWPEESLKVIRIMMLLVIGLSILTNLILGLQYVYMIPQNRYMHFCNTSICFFTGSLLLYSLLLYHQKLRRGQHVHFSTFKITWVPLTAYLTSFLLLVCAALCLLQCKWHVSRDTSMKTCSPTQDRKDEQLSGNSMKVRSFSEGTVMTRSIVHAHPHHSEDDIDQSHHQMHHVTWDL